MTQPEARPENLVRLHKLVQASPQQVYDTWLDASTYPKWFAPERGVTCTQATIDPRVGGALRIELLAGEHQVVGFGKFIELVSGKKLVYSWGWENEPNASDDTRITVELFEADNPHSDRPATEIVLTHEGLNTASSRSDHTGGWWGCLRAIGFFVRGVDPVEAMYGQSAGAAAS